MNNSAPYPNTYEFEDNIPSHVKTYLYFLKTEKGKDISTIDGLLNTRKWVETTDPENLMQGEYVGVPTSRNVLMWRKEKILDAIDWQRSFLEKNANPVA